MGIRIRVRQDDDLDDCVAALAAVHAADAYPMNWPADPHCWLSPEAMLRAWVAVGHPADGHTVVVGHLLLSGTDWEDTAEVGRLFVTPVARGHGAGTGLLHIAKRYAAVRRLTLVLDVAAADRTAITLYERTGWRRTETVPADWAGPSGEPVLLHRYAF